MPDEPDHAYQVFVSQAVTRGEFDQQFLLSLGMLGPERSVPSRNPKLETIP